MQQVARLLGVIKVYAHMCEFGMNIKRKESTAAKETKPTRFMTNPPYIATELNRQCKGNHEHFQLLVSWILSMCSSYFLLCEGVVLKCSPFVRCVFVFRDELLFKSFHLIQLRVAGGASVCMNERMHTCLVCFIINGSLAQEGSC